MMKVLRILLLAIGFCWLTTSQSEAQGYKISIQATGWADTSVYLAYHFGTSQYMKDTVKANSKGLAVFEGKEPLPGGMYIFLDPRGNYFEFLVDDDQEFSLATDTISYNLNMKVKGSELNSLFFKDIQFLDQKRKQQRHLQSRRNATKANKDSLSFYTKKLDELDTEVETHRNALKAKGPDLLYNKILNMNEQVPIPDFPRDADGNVLDSAFKYKYYKRHYFDNIPFDDDRLLRSPFFHPKVRRYMKKVISQHPDTVSKEIVALCERAKANEEVFKFMVGYWTSFYERTDILGHEAAFVALAKAFYATEQVPWVEDAQRQKIVARATTLGRLLVGQQAPHLTLKDTAGKYQNLYDIKARYTVLVFWDPECGHCKKAIPLVKEVVDARKDKADIVVYSAITETDREPWVKFIKTNKLDFINVADLELQNTFRTVYDITSTPKVFILDRQKKILANRLGAEQLGEILDSFILMYGGY